MVRVDLTKLNDLCCVSHPRVIVPAAFLESRSKYNFFELPLNIDFGVLLVKQESFLRNALLLQHFKQINYLPVMQ